MPEHVGIGRGDVLRIERQEIERNHIRTIERPQFAWDIAVGAAIVKVVRASHEHKRRLAAPPQLMQCRTSVSEQSLLKRTLSPMGKFGCIIAAAIVPVLLSRE